MKNKTVIQVIFLQVNAVPDPLPALRCTVDVRDGSAQFVL